MLQLMLLMPEWKKGGKLLLALQGTRHWFVDSCYASEAFRFLGALLMVVRPLSCLISYGFLPYVNHFTTSAFLLDCILLGATHSGALMLILPIKAWHEVIKWHKPYSTSYSITVVCFNVMYNMTLVNPIYLCIALLLVSYIEWAQLGI